MADDRQVIIHYDRGGRALCSRYLGPPTGLKVSTRDVSQVNCKRCVAKILRSSVLYARLCASQERVKS